MVIDWFTVGAQLLNFLVLVWLLMRYLYKPVLDAIDAREQRIAAELATAQKLQAQAQVERDSLLQKNDDFDRERNTHMQAARSEATAERSRLLEDARQAAEGQRAKRLVALESELQKLHDDIVQRSRTEVLAIANKVLGDLAGTSLDQRMVEVFLLRLQSLNTADKQALAQALKPASTTALMRSAFELLSEQRQSIQQALQGSVAPDLQVRFETDPALISGIELSANGWKLAWNIADFLGTLEQQTEILNKDSAGADPPDVATGAEP